MKPNLSLTAVALAAAVLAPSAFATEGHAHSDVEFGTFPGGDVNGTIVVDPEDEVLEMAAGLKLYETEFGGLEGPYVTDDPGFNNDEFLSEGGQGVDGTIIGWRVEDNLRKWNGTSWVSGGFDELITIDGQLSTSTAVSEGGGAGGTGFIDAFDNGGQLHTHVDFTISSTSGTPMFGAYLLKLSLIGFADQFSAPSSAYNDSDPFWLVLGLLDEIGGTFTEEDFETAVSAVPLPAGVWLLGSAVISLAGAGRRARRTA